MRKLVFLLALLGIAFESQAQKAELIPPLSHARHVGVVVASPDGKYVLTGAGSGDNTLIMWNINGQLVKILQGHNFPIREAAFSSKGNFITSLERNSGKLFLWTGHGVFLDTLKSNDFYTSSAFFPEEDKLLMGTSTEGRLLAVNLQGKVLDTLATTGLFGLSKVAVSPNGKFIASGDEVGMVRLYHAEGKLIKENSLKDNEEIIDLVFSPDNKYLIASGKQGNCKVFSAVDGIKVKELTDRKHRIGYVAFSPKGDSFASADPFSVEITLWDTKTFKDNSFKASRFDINDVCFTTDGKSLLVCGLDRNAQRVDLSGKLECTYGNAASPVSSVAFSPGGRFVVSGGNSINIRIWDKENNRVYSIPKGSEYDSPLAINPHDSSIIIGETGKFFRKIWLDSLQKKPQLLPKNRDFSVSAIAISPDGRSFAASDFKGGIRLYSTKDGSEIWKFQAKSNRVSCLQFSSDGRFLLSAYNKSSSPSVLALTEVVDQPETLDGQPVLLHDARNGKVLHQFGKSADQAVFSPGDSLIASNEMNALKIWRLDSTVVYECDDVSITSLAFSPNGKSIAVGFAQNYAHRYSLETSTRGRILQEYQGHLSGIRALSFSKDSRYLLTGSSDNSAKIWEVDDLSQKAKITLISVDSVEWVVISPDGLFDASPGGMNKLHLAQDLKVIELDQIKQRYYQPNLLSIVFSGKANLLRNTSVFEELQLYPDIKAKIDANDQLVVHLIPNGASVGKVSLYVNNKEVEHDINPLLDTLFSVSMKPYARYFIDTNVISLRAYNVEGWLKSAYFDIPYIRPPGLIARGSGDNPNPSNVNTLLTGAPPSFFAIVVGTSTYANPKLNLTFADADADAMAKVFATTAPPVFEDRVTIYKFTTSSTNNDSIPSKKNIEAAFNKCAAKATPDDVLVVYFAGHGITYGSGDSSQFYYLTKDILDDNLSDDAIRQHSAISTQELTSWLNKSPALKQVMIIDACNSGKIADAFSTGRSVDPSQQFLLDRMKDRTGVFVLAGSAANQKSYEGTLYNHGLLTYSLLEGINNRSFLRDNRFLDVSSMFLKASDRVPFLAKGLNGIQDPVPIIPIRGASFDIGSNLVGDIVELGEPKPLFIRSNFQEEAQFFDVIGLAAAMDRKLQFLAGAPKSNLSFADTDFVDKGYSLKGRYTINNGAVTVKGIFYKGKQALGPFETTGAKDNLDELASNLFSQVRPMIKK